MRGMHVWMLVLMAMLLVAVGGIWLGAANHEVIARSFGNAGEAVPSGSGAGQAAQAPPAKGREVLYWTDPMYNPPYISDKPGKSPMGMDLLPVYEDEVAAGPGVTIDPVVVQNMGLRVAKVEEGNLTKTIRVVGTLAEPEQSHTEVNLRVSGWIEKLYANVDGMAVAEGDPLFDLYSPDLVAASDELIAARKALDAMAAGGDALMRSSSQLILEAAKRKLSLSGLTGKQIEQIAKLDKSPATFSFLSPRTGHVAEKMVVEGASVKAGDRIMVLSDRSNMWLLLQVFERQLQYVPVGTAVRATFAANSGEPVEGKVDFIYPHLDPMTRTAKVRVVLANPDHRLHEGMYATADIDVVAATGSRIVPREAVIDSGTRQIVFVSDGGGKFSPRNVTVGASGHVGTSSGNDDSVQILTGLAAGDTVVTSGQFLLDSESRTEEAIQKHLSERLLSAQAGGAGAGGEASATMPAAMPTAESDAVVKAYLDSQGKLGTQGATAIDPGALVQAADLLASQAAEKPLRDIAGRISKATAGLRGQTLEAQRESFKAVSKAVIELAGQVRISKSAAGSLLQYHCPMEEADWLQSTDGLANPFTNDTMKTCGTLVRKFSVEAASPLGGGGK